MTEPLIDGGTNRAARPPDGLFVCLHGSAKSLIAAEHFNRIVRERGLELCAESAGVEPDPAVPENVISGLRCDGIDVRRYVPRAADPERLRAAPFVVSFGCELLSATPAARVVRWDDMPMVSDGFDLARDAIVARVEGLIATLSCPVHPQRCSLSANLPGGLDAVDCTNGWFGSHCDGHRRRGRGAHRGAATA